MTAPMANVTAAHGKLQQIAADVAADLLLISKPTAGSITVSASQPSARLQDVLRAAATAKAIEWASRELIQYTPGQEIPAHQLMWVPVTEVPGLNITGLSDDVTDLPPFDGTEQALKQLRLSVIRLGIGTHRLMFFREINRTNAAGLRKKLAIFRTGNYLDLAPENTLFVDRDVDAALIDGYAFFASRSRFERVFGFLEQMKAQAVATFETVTKNLEIENIAEFKAAAGTQLQMLAKMASIKAKIDKYPAYAQSLTMPNLVAFVRANPHTGVRIVGSGASAKLVFEEDVQHRFKILKLLDDDYLNSQLTSLNYEANSKGHPL